MVSKRTLLSFLRRCRNERLSVNQIFDDELDLTFYGQPLIEVVDGAWHQVTTRVWDHTMESIEEAIEIAEQHAGWVSIRYPVVLINDEREEQEIDDGFEVKVWPDFALRTHNDYIEITDTNDD